LPSTDPTQEENAAMILVTGATGTVGGAVVRQLLAAGHPVRALVRQPGAGRVPDGVEVAYGDLSRPETLAAALSGVERMYLLAPLAPDLPRWEADAIDAARAAGVRHVVKHSNLGADDPDATTMQRWHRAGERLLEASAMAWTFVRPTGFMSNALGWADTIRAQGTVYAPAGDGKLAAVDPRDIAAVAVAALTVPGHEGRVYDITGPAALSTADQIAAIGAAIGRPLRYVDIPESAARDGMRASGMPGLIVEALLEFMALVRAGRADTVSDAVSAVTGRPARTFQAWTAEHADAFR
jgi:uncharacterized protein YbjT (DUF2867 family)